MSKLQDDVDFISGNTDVRFSFRKSTNGSNTIDMVIVAFKGKENRQYDPIRYLDLTLLGYYQKIDNMTDLTARIKEAYDARAMVIHLINLFKSEIAKANAPITAYSFSDIIEQIDSLIDYVKIDLDNKRYNLEVEKLNKENKLFYLPYWLSGLALIVSVATPIITTLLQDKPEPQQIILIPEGRLPKMQSQDGAAASSLDSPLNNVDVRHEIVEPKPIKTATGKD